MGPSPCGPYVQAATGCMRSKTFFAITVSKCTKITNFEIICTWCNNLGRNGSAKILNVYLVILCTYPWMRKMNLLIANMIFKKIHGRRSKQIKTFDLMTDKTTEFSNQEQLACSSDAKNTFMFYMKDYYALRK